MRDEPRHSSTNESGPRWTGRTIAVKFLDSADFELELRGVLLAEPLCCQPQTAGGDPEDGGGGGGGSEAGGERGEMSPHYNFTELYKLKCSSQCLSAHTNWVRPAASYNSQSSSSLFRKLENISLKSNYFIKNMVQATIPLNCILIIINHRWFIKKFAGFDIS